ncbi:MAG TPA: RCC1 domain-containing protein, partial [Nakamurella sp.]
GNGGTTNSSTPVTVSGLTGVTAIAAGATAGYALLTDGTVQAWGYGADGELGNGGTTNSSTPAPVAGLTGVTAIAAGGSTSYALTH